MRGDTLTPVGSSVLQLAIPATIRIKLKKSHTFFSFFIFIWFYR